MDMFVQTPSLLFLFLFGFIHAGPTCFKCLQAEQVADCATVTCADNEQCYLDKTMDFKEDLVVRYDAGCRLSAVCAVLNGINAGKKKRMTVTCAECCLDASNKFGPCNAHLCGLTHPRTTTRNTATGFVRTGPTCIACTDAVQISECLSNEVKCSVDEQCFLEKIVKRDFSIRYNAGCRQTTMCDSSVISIGKKKRDMLQFSACCTNLPNEFGPCNARLLGQSSVDRQATCVACDGVQTDVHSCTTTITCPQHEACYSGIRIVDSAVRYVLGCYDKRICLALMASNQSGSTSHHHHGRVVHGDTGTRLCDACCVGERCNAAADCFELRKNMIAADYNI